MSYLYWIGVLVKPYMALVILASIDSGNGLGPDGAKPLPESMLTYHLDPHGYTSMKIAAKYNHFHYRKLFFDMTFAKFLPFCSDLKAFGADSKFVPSQWETLQSNADSHWLGTKLESALVFILIAGKLPAFDTIQGGCVIVYVTAACLWYSEEPSLKVYCTSVSGKCEPNQNKCCCSFVLHA